MGTTLLWTLHLAFSLLLLAASLAWGHGRSAALRRTAVALALLPLFALHGLLAWKALVLRFDIGVAHVPWMAASSLLVLHLAGAALLLTRARREPGAAAWPAGPLALCALVALALDGTTLWNLELQARLRVGDLRLEAGRIAWRESPPRPAPEENAAPIYLDVARTLEQRLGEQLVAWRPAVRGDGALDTEDPELREALEAASTPLESVHAATLLPACWFEPEHEMPGFEVEVGVPRLTTLILLADVLALRARTRAAQGKTAEALADVDGLFVLSDHVAQTPLLISVLVASAVREVGVTTLAHVLAAEQPDAPALARYEVTAMTALADVVPRALAMEEAFGLSAVGLLARGDVGGFTEGWEGIGALWLDEALYAVFLLDDEVAGYRQSTRELQDLARLPLHELLAEPDPDAMEIRSRGVLATMLIPNVRHLVLALHRTDARMELAGLALAARRHELDHGRYPTSLSELEVSASGVVLEGDGSYVRFVRPDLQEGEREVDLRLPPEPPE